MVDVWKRVVSAAILVLFFGTTQANAQQQRQVGPPAAATKTLGPAPSADFWTKLAKDIADGCSSNQRENGALDILKPEILGEICACTGRSAVDRLKDSKPFEAAYRARNSDEMTKLLKATAWNTKGEPVAVACANEVRLLHGGKSKNMLKSAEGSASGLAGQARENFMAASMATCQTDLPKRVPDRAVSGQKLVQACRCITEGMAARMTDDELNQIIRSGKLDQSQLADRKAVMTECAQILNE